MLYQAYVPVEVLEAVKVGVEPKATVAETGATVGAAGAASNVIV